MKHRLATTALALFALTGSAAADRIGEATRVQTAVNGDHGAIAVSSPVHRNERIRTSQSGLGEFIFEDGTQLAVGEGSVIKLDKFIYDDSGSAVEKFTLNATYGTFRWVSGKVGDHAGYDVRTPSGTIGIRGTKFDLYVARDGTTAVVLLSGAVRFCGAGGCVNLQNRCDCVVAKRGQQPSVSRASRKTLTALGNKRAFPFLSGNQHLSGRFGASTGCGMNIAILETPNAKDPKAKEKAAPEKAAPEKTKPDKPTKPDRPDKPTTHTVPGTPDVPDKPDTKRGHGYGDKNHTHVHDPQGKALGQDKGRNNEHGRL
jgi:hypothetical protein